MACLESAIFSIDLDDDYNDDIIYQEGGSGCGSEELDAILNSANRNASRAL